MIIHLCFKKSTINKTKAVQPKFDVDEPLIELNLQWLEKQILKEMKMERTINNPAATSESATSSTSTSSTKLDLSIATAMRERIEDLAIQREGWENTLLSRSNQALYSIFKECVSLYRDLTTGDNLKEKKIGFRDHINLKGYKFKESSPLSLKVIRCIFGDKDRRRLSTYHTVLRVAIADNWSLEEVAAKIAERGGVQEISVRKANAMSQKDKAIAAQAALLNQSVASIDSHQLKSKHNSEQNEQQAVAVVTQLQDGTYSVHCIVHSNTAVNAALAAYFNANKSDLQKVTAQQQALLEAELRSKLINSAAVPANDALAEITA